MRLTNIASLFLSKECCVKNIAPHHERVKHSVQNQQTSWYFKGIFDLKCSTIFRACSQISYILLSIISNLICHFLCLQCVMDETHDVFWSLHFRYASPAKSQNETVKLHWKAFANTATFYFNYFPAQLLNFIASIIPNCLFLHPVCLSQITGDVKTFQEKLLVSKPICYYFRTKADRLDWWISDL